jgi:hypothetical protein
LIGSFPIYEYQNQTGAHSQKAATYITRGKIWAYSVYVAQGSLLLQRIFIKLHQFKTLYRTYFTKLVSTPATVANRQVIYPGVRTSIPINYPPHTGLLIAEGPAIPIAMKPITNKNPPSVTALNFGR